jgi:hypothetical protein
MPAMKNADNVRIYGGLDDAVWIAPLGTTLPVTLALDLPSPWVELGWLSEDGIPLSMTTDVQSFRGHQGGSLIRRKVVSTEKGISFTALEESPVVAKMYYGAADPVLLSPGVARMDLPESVGAQSYAAVVQLTDEDVVKFLCIERLDLGEREDVAHAGTDITGYGITGAIIGDAYILTNAPAFLEGLTAP